MRVCVCVRVRVWVDAEVDGKGIEGGTGTWHIIFIIQNYAPNLNCAVMV